jgi:hypothetical protein
VTAPTRETRVDLRSLLAGLGALVLLVSLFLDWYGDPDGDGGRTAWGSFELVDILLAALALVAIYELVRRISDRRRWPDAGALARLAGPVALVLVVVSLIDEPPLFALVDPDREVGIWLALAGGLLMTIGSLLTRVRVSFVVSDREPAGAAAPPSAPTPAHDPDAETRTLR